MPPTVLIVEPESSFTEVYRHWLDDQYLIQTARMEREALDILNPDIDLVLLDPSPSTNDTWSLLRELNARELEFRVIVVTAIEPDFDIIPLKLDDYLLKPVSKDELRSAVEQVLELDTYDVRRADRYALLSKKVALEAVKSTEELTANDAFRELEAELQAIKTGIDVFDPPEYPSGLN